MQNLVLNEKCALSAAPFGHYQFKREDVKDLALNCQLPNTIYPLSPFTSEVLKRSGTPFRGQKRSEWDHLSKSSSNHRQVMAEVKLGDFDLIKAPGREIRRIELPCLIFPKCGYL